MPALKPEILCTQWSVAAAVGKVVSFSIESERMGMILCASQTVATPFTRYRGMEWGGEDMACGEKGV